MEYKTIIERGDLEIQLCGGYISVLAGNGVYFGETLTEEEEKKLYEVLKEKYDNHYRDVTDCRNCRAAYYYSGHGECWAECSHPDSNLEPYQSILYGCNQAFPGVPAWCPLGLGGKNEKESS